MAGRVHDLLQLLEFVWLEDAGRRRVASAAQSADPSQQTSDAGTPEQAGNESTGSVPPPLGVPAAAEPGLLGSDPNDELSLGKKHYRANDFGLAEKHFRRAVETASARRRGMARPRCVL